MRISQLRLAALAAGVALILFGSPYVAAQTSASKEGAQVVATLTDGTVLQGMDRREGTYHIDGQDVLFFPNGFFFIDEGSRRVFFGSKLLRDVKPRPAVTEEKVSFFRQIAVMPEPIPEVDEVLSVGPWDEKQNRIVRFRSGLHEKKVEQHLSLLTPYTARTDATARSLAGRLPDARTGTGRGVRTAGLVAASLPTTLNFLPPPTTPGVSAIATSWLKLAGMTKPSAR